MRAPPTEELRAFWSDIWNPKDVDLSELTNVISDVWLCDPPNHADLVALATTAINKTKTAKAAGCDEIYHESIKASVNFAAYHSARMYEQLLRLDHTQWPRFLVRCVLLAKVPVPSMPKNWRPLGLYAAYEKVLIQMNLQRIISTMRSDVFCEVQAGVPGAGGALELAHAVQLHLTTKNAYRLTAVLLQLDLSRAYDMVRHVDVAEALLEAGVPRDVVRWTIMSLRCTLYRVRHPVVSQEFEVALGRGLPQGRPDSPLLFSLVMATLFRRVQAVATRECLGWCLGDMGDANVKHVACAAFFDDIWMMADDPGQLTRLTEVLLPQLEERGMVLNIPKAKYLANAFVRDRQFNLRGTELRAPPANEPVRLLGLRCAASGTLACFFPQRKAIAFRRSWAIASKARRFLLETDLLRRLDKKLAPTALWAAEVEWPSRSRWKHWCSFQVRCAIPTLLLKKQDDESVADFCRRRAIAASRMIDQVKLSRWGRHAARLYYRAASRMAVQAARASLLVRMATYRSRSWQRIHACVTQDTGRRCGRPWRWEDPIADHFEAKGLNWLHAASAFTEADEQCFVAKFEGP